MPLWSCCALGILIAAAVGAPANEIVGASGVESDEAAAVKLLEDPQARRASEDSEPEGGESSERGEEGENPTEKKEEGHIDAGISIMLLGSISFMMVLFYLLNHKDEQFVYYTWSVISSTISIFSAVLLFQAFDGMLNYLVIGLEGMEEAEKKGPGLVQIFLGFAHMLFWFMMLQFTLALISGALRSGTKDEEQEIEAGRIASQEEQEEKEDRERAEEMVMEVNMKCFAILLGHITGFASISAFGNLQQMLVAEHGLFPGNFFIGIMVPLGAWVYTRILGLITDHFRDRVSKGDDGKVDEAEMLWDEETEETEDDVVGLCISFLLIQIIRFHIGGILPNSEGEEEGEPKHKTSESLKLFGTGLVWVFVLLLATQLCFKEESESRLGPQIRNVVGMCFAWCLYFSVGWAIDNNFTFQSPMEGEIALALTVSAMALSCIRILDKLADLDWTKKPVDKFIRGDLIVAMGILIGFSWEKDFDIAVTDVANHWKKVLAPPITKLILAILLAAIVIPAWWKFILPTKIQHEKELEEAEKLEEHAEKGALEQPFLRGKPTANMSVSELRKHLRSVQSKLAAKNKEFRQMENDLHKHRRVVDDATTHIQRRQDLEEKNRDLEATMEAMLSEIQELHKLADMIKA